MNHSGFGFGICKNDCMTKYLISFPSSAMRVSAVELPAVAEASRAVILEAKKAGVYVFGGGIDEDVPPVIVSADRQTREGTYPETQRIEGGYTVLELPDRQAAIEWAAKIAESCRCDQELREFQYDPIS